MIKNLVNCDSKLRTSTIQDEITRNGQNQFIFINIYQ